MTKEKSLKKHFLGLSTYRPFKFNPYIMNVSAISYVYLYRNVHRHKMPIWEKISGRTYEAIKIWVDEQ